MKLGLTNFTSWSRFEAKQITVGINKLCLLHILSAIIVQVHSAVSMAVSHILSAWCSNTWPHKSGCYLCLIGVQDTIFM